MGTWGVDWHECDGAADVAPVFIERNIDFFMQNLKNDYGMDAKRAILHLVANSVGVDYIDGRISTSGYIIPNTKKFVKLIDKCIKTANELLSDEYINSWISKQDGRMVKSEILKLRTFFENVKKDYC